MKKKIILGLLVLVVLLFFIASSWALDWKRAQQQYYERPEQEVDMVLPSSEPEVIPASTIKFIFILNGQTLPTLLFIDKQPVQAKAKVEKPQRCSSSTLGKMK